jgi:hypothetical protein
MMKYCYACKQDNPLAQFAVNRSRADGHDNMCRDCKKAYNASYYRATKERHNPKRAERRAQIKTEARKKVYQYLKEHPCVDCGETDIVVLDFDHQRDKVQEICDMIAGACSWPRILAEIEKCEVVCANDHRRRTARAFGWQRAMAA